MKIEYIKQLLKTWFHFPEKKLYCQVATIGKNRPHIRTMDFYQVTDEGKIILLTDTSTNKWSDLNESKQLALCVMHLDHGQIVVEGEADLKTSETDYLTCQEYWVNLLDDYWRGFYLDKNKKMVEKIPTSFGVIVVNPAMWEVIEANQEDFIKSTRTQFNLIDGQWLKQNLVSS